MDGTLLLFLQVDNYIIGALCGVMNQMASACGENNKFLAMVCQALLGQVLLVKDLKIVTLWSFGS
ncbi:unnamed protein product [Linum tenue]|uniref:Uncharacterized protein n=1 Tax=Linum tenue TaxID=586396 RepID=A0AAV0NIW9_9ROSI|nr:unnamed protein product [Linum tenue]